MSVELAEGATVAVGFVDSIVCGQANKWVELVCYYLCQGHTVKEATDMVNEMGDFEGTSFNNITIAGDKNYRLGE